MNAASQVPTSDDLYLGRYSVDGQLGAPLLYSREPHQILIGLTRSGKGARWLIPNLLRMKDRSLVVLDPKGQLAAVTARWRSTVSRVVMLNPFDVLGLGSAGFNPLAGLDPHAPTFFDDAMGLGEALVQIRPDERDPHWSESARNLIVALLMWEVMLAVYNRRLPSLARVRMMLTRPDRSKTKDGISELVSGLRHTLAIMCDEPSGILESLAGRFMEDNKEMAGIRSAADRHTSWLLSRPMTDDIGKNGIDFSALKKEPVTVYIILPSTHLRTHNAWLRAVIATALRQLQTPGGLATLFLMDEFASLGHLGAIEDAFGLVSGFRVQLAPILQDLNQLKTLYKDRWETFVGNAGIVQSFAPNDLTTARWLSERAGETTIVASSASGHAGQPASIAYQQERRPQFLPQEIMDLPRGSTLVFGQGSKAIPAFGAPYWEIPELKGRWDSDPYHQ